MTSAARLAYAQSRVDRAITLNARALKLQGKAERLGRRWAWTLRRAVAAKSQADEIIRVLALELKNDSQ